jgi:hypothetical protein
VVTGEEVEIRYVIPTSPKGEAIPFCHLRLDYFHSPMLADQVKEPLGRTLLPTQCGQPVDDLHAAFLRRLALALQTKRLPDFSPVSIQIVDFDQGW